MPITLTPEQIEEIRLKLPELPETTRDRFVRDYDLTPYDAHVLTLEKTVSEYFDNGAKLVKTPKIMANWIISELLRELAKSETAITDCRITPEKLAGLVKLIEDNTISGKIAKDVFVEMFNLGKDAKTVVDEKGLVQVTDSSAIETFVVQAIEMNPAQVEQYRSGKTMVLQFFVGQVMKLSKGKANPQLVVELLKSKLDS